MDSFANRTNKQQNFLWILCIKPARYSGKVYRLIRAGVGTGEGRHHRLKTYQVPCESNCDTTCREITTVSGKTNQGLKGVSSLSMRRKCSQWCERCTSHSPLPSTDPPPPPPPTHPPTHPVYLRGGSISKPDAQVSSAHTEHGLTTPATGEDKYNLYRSAYFITAGTWKLCIF